MKGEPLDEMSLVVSAFSDKMKKYISYIKYLQTLKLEQLTLREQEMLKKHGDVKKKK